MKLTARNLRSGFTLVEVMIVIAIIGVLASLAIPGLLRARVNANEGAVKQSLRVFTTASESYRSAQSTPTYAQLITDLTGSNPPYLDSTWVSLQRHQYNFSYAVPGAPANTYSLLATPVSGTGASTMYCVDQQGVIYYSTTSITGATTGCSGGAPIG